MTLISVVMSVYNGAALLRETLDSILAQEDADFELVAIDDGSNDDSGRILDDYAARDPRVRVLHQANQGLTRALIAGCAAARGRYIARHDAGDLSHPRRLITQQRMLDADADVVFVSCATQFAGPELEPLWIMKPRASFIPTTIVDPTRPGFLTEGPTHHGSAMFRREAYERANGYRAAFYYGQDYDLWYRLASLGAFQSSSEVLYTARITPDSISTEARKRQEQLARLSRRAFELRLEGKDESEVLAQASALGRVRSKGKHSRASGLYFIGEALRRNRDPRAGSYLRQSIVTWPWSVRAWLRYLQWLMHN